MQISWGWSCVKVVLLEMIFYLAGRLSLLKNVVTLCDTDVNVFWSHCVLHVPWINMCLSSQDRRARIQILDPESNKDLHSFPFFLLTYILITVWFISSYIVFVFFICCKVAANMQNWVVFTFYERLYLNFVFSIFQSQRVIAHQIFSCMMITSALKDITWIVHVWNS